MFTQKFHVHLNIARNQIVAYRNDTQYGYRYSDKWIRLMVITEYGNEM